MFLKYKIKRTN